MEDWLTSDAFADLAGISSRKARRALSLAADGITWRGCELEVRTFHGRGGRSGIQYQVKVTSLSSHFQDRLKALQTSEDAAAKIRLGDEARFERAWKHEIIKDAIAHPKGSSARKAEIAKLDGKSRLDWTGHQRKLTQSTLYKWIETYAAEGIQALAQRVRSDKGQKKVIISRAWSDAVALDDATKAQIEADLRTHIRSLYKSGGQFKQTILLASNKLRDITLAYKCLSPETAANDRIFAVPEAFVKAEAAYKAVYRHKYDRKASEDSKPRIRRTIQGLQPMEVVVMDVHHINVHVAREDGTYSTAKLLAFYDVATARVFCEIIQFNDRGGVRNSDVIQAFVNMCQHPAFGVPQFLYADNGSEYRFADMLEDALKLGSNVIAYEGREGMNRVLRAKAYNAAAKHVEGWFRQMNQQYFRHIQGWRDDDPMNPKRPELGKLHKPYAEGFDAFCEEVFDLLTAYEHIPQKGSLSGKSPAKTFKAHVESGWKATLLDPDGLLTVFTKPDTRVVEKHGVSVKGKAWTCDGLLEYFGRTVMVHIPAFHSFAELLITDADGNHIGVAVADEAFSVLDTRGAMESARRDKVRKAALRKMDQSVPNIDVGAELIALGRAAKPVVPNTPDATISVRQVGSTRLAMPPKPLNRNSRQHEDDELRRSNDLMLEQLSKVFSNGGNQQ